MLDQSRLDELLADPRVSGSPAPPGLVDSFTLLLPKLLLRGQAFGVLDEFPNHDSRVKGYAKIFQSHQEDADRYLDIVQKAARREEPLALEGAINLYGVSNARNWLLALNLHRVVRDVEPDWSKPFQPNQFLPCSIQAETELGGEGSKATGLAFLAGMVYDALLLLAEQKGNNKKLLADFTSATFKHGLKAALVARHLAKFAGTIPNAEMIAAAAILHDSGKVLLAFLRPELASFRAKMDKKALPRTIRHRVETLAYGMDHSAASALLCRASGWFAPIERAVLHHHSPALLAKRDPKSFGMACLLALATNIASAYRKPSGPDDPVLRDWVGPEIQGGPLSRDAVRSAVDKLF